MADGLVENIPHVSCDGAVSRVYPAQKNSRMVSDDLCKRFRVIHSIRCEDHCIDATVKKKLKGLFFFFRIPFRQSNQIEMVFYAY